MAAELQARPGLPAVRDPLEGRAPPARPLQFPDLRVPLAVRVQPAILVQLAVKGMLGQLEVRVPPVAPDLRALRDLRDLRAQAQIFLLLMKAQSSQPESYRLTSLVLV